MWTVFLANTRKVTARVVVNVAQADFESKSNPRCANYWVLKLTMFMRQYETSFVLY